MNLDLATDLVTQQILPRYGNVEAAIIGGSIARNEGTPTSDIDLLVIEGKNILPTTASYAGLHSLAHRIRPACGDDVDYCRPTRRQNGIHPVGEPGA
jgi:predicted nucleotidyltransferase